MLLMKENNKNNEDLKNKQNLMNSNANIAEGGTKEPAKSIKSPPRSVSERLNKPPIKKGPNGTDVKKIDLQPKSLSPEPVITLTRQQSNGEILRKPKPQTLENELRKAEAFGKAMSPEPPAPLNNSVGAQDERSKGVQFRLGKYNYREISSGNFLLFLTIFP